MADTAKMIAAIALVVALVGLGTTLYGFTSLVSPSAATRGPAGPPGANGSNGAPGSPGHNGSSGPPGQNGTPGQNGANGSQGPPGSNGSQGPPGRNGTNGSSPTYATFNASFVLEGQTSMVAFSATPCVDAGRGAYVCNVTFAINGTRDVEFQGLNYTPSTSFYFAGSNPTTDWLLEENSTTTFSLWFQVVATSGSLEPTVVLHLGELSRS